MACPDPILNIARGPCPAEEKGGTDPRAPWGDTTPPVWAALRGLRGAALPFFVRSKGETL